MPRKFDPFKLLAEVEHGSGTLLQNGNEFMNVIDQIWEILRDYPSAWPYCIEPLKKGLNRIGVKLDRGTLQSEILQFIRSVQNINDLLILDIVVDVFFDAPSYGKIHQESLIQISKSSEDFKKHYLSRVARHQIRNWDADTRRADLYTALMNLGPAYILAEWDMVTEVLAEVLDPTDQAGFDSLLEQFRQDLEPNGESKLLIVVNRPQDAIKKNVMVARFVLRLLQSLGNDGYGLLNGLIDSHASTTEVQNWATQLLQSVK